VEQVPWAQGKERQTGSYRQFLARWAKRLSWKETAEVFQTSWESVYRAVAAMVEYGLAHRDLDEVTQVGIDEIAVFKGHQYLTLVYQLDTGCRRLLWCGAGHTAKTLLRFFRFLGSERSQRLQAVCSDMWAAYLKVIKKKAPQALHILDRFHIMKKFNEAIDQERRDEVKRLKAQGEESILIRSRWILLKRPAKLSDSQIVRLSELVKANLSCVKAYLMREQFQRFWEYQRAAWASKFLDQWITQALQSNIEPMKKVAKSLRKHQPLILNWFKAGGTLSSGTVEGFNNKAKLTIKKAYGFRSVEHLKIALYHTLGDLPEPPMTHRFC